MKTENPLFDKLNRKPFKRAIKVHQGRKHIPISTIEAQLDRLFGPDGWQVENFNYQVVVNEVIGSIDLLFWSDRRGQWIRRTGAAAAQIQMKRRKDGQPQTAINVESKIINTLEKMHPKLRSSCIKNAAKSLGRFFGRDLGRKEEDQEPYNNMTERAEVIALAESVAEAPDLVALDDILYSISDDLRSEPVIFGMFEYRRTELKALELPEPENNQKELF